MGQNLGCCGAEARDEHEMSDALAKSFDSRSAGAVSFVSQKLNNAEVPPPGKVRHFRAETLTSDRGLPDLIKQGDALSIVIVVKLKLAVHRMLIRRGVKKDVKYKEAKFDKYFEDADYFDTIEPDRSVDLSLLFDLAPKLSSRIHYYKQTKATYDGEWLGGFRHGQGTMIFADGTTYQGSW